MFQKVMVQITKQKKEKSIINRIIVDVFQLNKKLKQNQPHTHTHRYATTTKTQKETRRNPSKKNDMKIFIVKKESSSVENNSNNNNKLLFVNKTKNNQVFRTFRKVLPLDRLFPYFDFPFLVYYFFRFFFSKLI